MSKWQNSINKFGHGSWASNQWDRKFASLIDVERSAGDFGRWRMSETAIAIFFAGLLLPNRNSMGCVSCFQFCCISRCFGRDGWMGWVLKFGWSLRLIGFGDGLLVGAGIGWKMLDAAVGMFFVEDAPKPELNGMCQLFCRIFGCFGRDGWMGGLGIGIWVIIASHWVWCWLAGRLELDEKCWMPQSGYFFRRML